MPNLAVRTLDRSARPRSCAPAREVKEPSCGTGRQHASDSDGTGTEARSSPTTFQNAIVLNLGLLGSLGPSPGAPSSLPK